MIIGKKILHFKEIDSTNEEARRLIKKGSGEGLVVVADMQTKGRGKPGSGWFSPKGNLYFSAVVKPYRNPKDLAPITLLGALAARSVIMSNSKLPVLIKWPNDLRIHGKKVGGILTERMPSGQIIIGIGVNLNSRRLDFPDNLRSSATSFRIEAGKRFSIDSFISQLVPELDRQYRSFLQRS